MIKHGWLFLDKPQGISSAKAVHLVKKALGLKKAGHAGTLDPMASGLLPIALGEATKTMPYLNATDKAYEFEVTWGEGTDTDDAEGKVIETSDIIPSEKQILEALPSFIGCIDQIPPIFSAIKSEGERAYKKARAGENFILKSRPIIIDTLLLEQHSGAKSRFSMHCSKGTYVRSVARDLARKLGTVGHVSTLRRTKVGKFTLSMSILLATLQEIVYNPAKHDVIHPMDIVLDDIPALCLSSELMVSVQHGNEVPCEAELPGEAMVKLMDERGQLVALATYGEGHVKPKRVFNI